MKNLFSASCIACAALLAFYSAHAAETTAAANDEQEILKVERDACAAYLRGDADYLDRLFTEDFHVTNGRAEMNNKAEELAEVRAKQVRYTTFENHDQKILLHGDTAVVIGITTVKGSQGTDQPFAIEVRFTDTFTRINGQWRMLAGHSSRIAAKQS